MRLGRQHWLIKALADERSRLSPVKRRASVTQALLPADRAYRKPPDLARVDLHAKRTMPEALKSPQPAVAHEITGAGAASPTRTKRFMASSVLACCLLVATLGPPHSRNDGGPGGDESQSDVIAAASGHALASGSDGLSASLISGRHRIEATNTAAFRMDAAPPAARPSDPARSPAEPEEAPSVEDRTVARGFMIHLGQASNEPDARTLLIGFLVEHGEIFKSLDFVIEAADDAYQVQAGPFRNRTEAERTCDQIKSRGQTCAVVAG